MPNPSHDMIRWLPRPRSVKYRSGNLDLPTAAVIEITAAAKHLATIIEREWPADAGSVRTTLHDGTGYGFQLAGKWGGRRPDAVSAPDQPEHYGLRIGSRGISAAAADYRGLLYAWQALKQILREKPARLPFLTIQDGPDIGWRAYHIDLKGTRRTPANLERLAERLAELRINALMVEYEDSLRLQRHPTLAVESAMDSQTVRQWIEILERYGISVIPLVQTLGHWQYVLVNPQYAHLRELPEVTSDACPLHPGTWELARDFIDEIIDLHPDAPIIHIGLDETALLGSCPRCKAHLGNRPPIALHIEWLNRIADYVRSRGHTPMAWADKLVSELDGPHESELRHVHPGTVFLDWDYGASGPLTRGLKLNGHRVSEKWLQRPDRIEDTFPPLSFGAGSDTIEKLAATDQEKAQSCFADPDDARWIRNFRGAARLRDMGFDVFGAAGLRVSYHGCIAPRFLTAQYNAMAWADACRKHKLAGLIGTSWSRGHSWAGMNAHPELDWYAVATLAQSCWSGLKPEKMPDFDRRFAFQFFGLPNGSIGDAFALFHRSSPRTDHAMDNFSIWIERLVTAMRPDATRNLDVFDLFHAVVRLQALRLDLDFSLLEGAYFTALWQRVPPAFKTTMRAAIRQRLEGAEERCVTLKRMYGQSLVAADADELAETQLRFLINQVIDLKNRLFPEIKPTEP